MIASPRIILNCEDVLLIKIFNKLSCLSSSSLRPIKVLTSFVALYMSAWIEIENATVLSAELFGRTLHECVD